MVWFVGPSGDICSDRSGRLFSMIAAVLWICLAHKKNVSSTPQMAAWPSPTPVYKRQAQTPSSWSARIESIPASSPYRIRPSQHWSPTPLARSVQVSSGFQALCCLTAAIEEEQQCEGKVAWASNSCVERARSREAEAAGDARMILLWRVTCS
jgi:hypothetical protein